MNEEGGLRVSRLKQIRFGTLEEDWRERAAENFIGLPKYLGGGGKSFLEIFAHADGLGALARRKEVRCVCS